MGYEHVALNGQKAYHGVATLSRIPFYRILKKEFCNKGDSRHIAVTIADKIEIHNFYVPSGGDIPDRKLNEKFNHKLNFMKEMAAWFKKKHQKRKNKLILVGDLNVAPLETDVWSHKQLLNVVSHTPIEVEHLKEVIASHGWVDVVRRDMPEPEPIYTWWSYRSPDWTKNNRGRRLDHIWVTPALEKRSRKLEIHKAARSWKKPSDHVPVLMSLEI
jgi:exodeoxyribonuclease-3